MRTHVNIGLIGDYSASVTAHRAIPLALQRAAADTGIAVAHEWVPTEGITAAARVARFDGLWCVPASPYRSMAGALLAICHARENNIPFLGTCGGFQHAVVELEGHPFFVATLFQPERAALRGAATLLANAFVRASAA
jgi:CTP synthase (UTP-ammonia lyase)